MEKVKIEELGPNMSIFGNRGNVWTDTCHAYESGRGNLCGTPALSNNWARLDEVKTVGCPKCLEKIADRRKS